MHFTIEQGGKLHNMALLTLLVVSMYLLGCSSTEKVELSFGDSVILDCGGGNKITLYPDSQLYRDIASWFEKNKLGWKKSPASYVPSIVIYDDKFNVNIVNDIVVINSGSSQLVKKIGSDSDLHGICGPQS